MLWCDIFPGREHCCCEHFGRRELFWCELFGLREFLWRDVLPYALVQIVGGVLGAFAVHLMFDLPILQLASKAREGTGQLAAEAIASFGLIFTIIVTLRRLPASVPASVALYISAAYWFTSSTSFANPAITLVRSLSDTFAGIAPADVPGFTKPDRRGDGTSEGRLRVCHG